MLVLCYSASMHYVLIVFAHTIITLRARTGSLLVTGAVPRICTTEELSDVLDCAFGNAYALSAATVLANRVTD